MTSTSAEFVGITINRFENNSTPRSNERESRTTLTAY
jgi:hypothetical protein